MFDEVASQQQNTIAVKWKEFRSNKNGCCIPKNEIMQK